MGYRRTAATITLATSIVLLAALARGAQAPLPREAIDLYVRPLVDGEYCQAVVLGLVDDGGPRVFGYGKKSAQDEARPDGDTVFEIGSATKVFTALLLVDMVRRGEVSLDDPVQKFLPDDVKVPKKGEQPITLDHLASHRSGLPRMPDNFTPKDPANPYADYSVKQMYEFLSRCQPAREAGEAFEYSNLGAGLLGHALARRAGKTYEALVVERICKPLGMSDTAVTLKQPTRSRLAPGHDAAGEPASNWDIPTLAGAGALRSTANDMAKFLVANLHPETAGDLAGPIRMIQQPRAPADAANSVGLGWHVRARDQIVWHNGQTGGYHSFVGILPSRGVGLVILSNTATMQPDGAGFALLRRMAGEPSEPPKLRMPVKVDPKVLDEYAGEYPLSPLFKLTVTRAGDRLMCQATGQQNLRIFPRSETEFLYRVVDAGITFQRGPDGKVSGLVLHQNGVDLPGVKQK